jgi:aryl-alcohol dehydrogenase-like predicted oxidoreductase
MRKRSTPINATDTALTPATVRATANGSARYCARFGANASADFFRPSTFGLTLSSLGVGTYLGDSTDAVDALYSAVVRDALEHGVNVVDTAINYRCQRSERAVGTALEDAIASGCVRRDEIVVCSKGGYIPLLDTPPASRAEYDAYVEREYLAPGIVDPEDVVAGGHSLAPMFLRYCIARSRQNLGVRTIDVYYLHNPEQQLGSISREQLHARLRAAFTVLEESVARRDIGVYGVATWNGLRVAPDAKEHLSLLELSCIAAEVAGDDHHFRAVQLPVNLAMTEAVRAPTQLLASGEMLPVLDAAAALDLTVVSSAALMQGQLAHDLPPAVREVFPSAPSDAARALAFARGLTGITTALVGTTSPEHLSELLHHAMRSALSS